jgi:hypothetical protein
MKSKNKIKFKCELAIGKSPKEADIAIASTDMNGTLGVLNRYVLQEYGYDEDEFISKEVLKVGFSALSRTGKKKILFVVTVSHRKTEINLRENLYNTLREFRGWFSDKKIWLPLMGTGVGKLSLEESLSITIETVNRFHAEFNSEGTFIISFPNDEKGEQLFDSFTKELSSEIKSDIQTAFKTFKGNYFIASAWYNNENNARQFYDKGLWENNSREEVISSVIKSVRSGDIVFLNSGSVNYDWGSPYRIIGVGKVISNPNSGLTIEIDWAIRDLQINIKGYENYNPTFAKLIAKDVDIFIESVGKGKIFHSGLLNTQDNIVQNSTKEVFSNRSRIADLIADNESGEDYLDINQDVLAFAKIMSAKSFTPPLAIALFGQWGSGKSFFMNKLKDQIDRLSVIDERIYCKGIAHVHFNAWSYLDANLWAGLVSKIFEGLHEYISNDDLAKDEKDSIKKELSNQLNVTQEEIRLLEKQKTAVNEQIKDLSQQKEQLTRILNDNIKAIENKSLKDIIDKIDLEFNINEKITKALNENKSYKETAEELKKIIPEKYWQNPSELYNQVRSKQTFLKEFFNRDKIGSNLFWLCLILIIIFITPAILNIFSEFLKNVNFIIPQAGLSVLIIIGSVWKRAEIIYIKLQPIVAAFWNIKTDYEKQVEEALFKYDQEEKALKLKIDQGRAELEVISEKVQQANTIKIDLEFRINNALATEALYSFIEKRSNSEDYKKYLGIVSIIRKDFEILSSLFLEHNNENVVAEEFRQKFDKPLERIILYVDDLDRCPEDRVVEVLEAVNLLMAFPLFIVVVGVDPRWVKNALIKKYQLQFAGYINGDKISKETEIIEASNYLEKIFQIPFHLKEATDKSVKHMLKTLSEPKYNAQESDSEVESLSSSENDNIRSDSTNITFDNKSITFTQNEKQANTSSEPTINVLEHLILTEIEIKLMQDLSEIIGNNPRAIKRFVNIYQIVRAHEGLDIDNEFEDKEFLVLMFLLAFSVGPFKNLVKSFKDFIYLAKNQNEPLSKFLFEEDRNLIDLNPQLNRLNSIMHEYNSLTNLLNEPISTFYNRNRFIQRFTFEDNILFN